MDDPTENCPYCSTECHADFFDNGAGMQQCGPYHCEVCNASEIGPYDSIRKLSKREEKFGWYAPNSEYGSSANVMNGKVVTSEAINQVYREHFMGNEVWNSKEYVDTWFKNLRKKDKDNG